MAEENIQKGGISVQTEHIFPVIKRWLYSDKEIFLREIVSNACDAVTKMKRLVSLGKASCEDAYRIDVIVDKELSTLTVRDNGIGMNAEEVKKYICQIALSGALEFIEQYEGEQSQGDGIIGHFGLGFYSAFMVSDRVEVVTKSFTDAGAVKWSCNEAGEYEMEAGSRESRGTDVIMHITEAEKEFLSKAKIEELLKKYCAFMPVEIFVSQVGEEKKEGEEEKPVNDTEPLWQKSPSQCTEEDYKKFYHQLFGDLNDPLFYVHINADFPLNFKGILYFPKLTHEYANLEGQVKLYYNQVFVADNIKEVIPDYLMLLKGALDCPELPLNVSRSYLQNSGYVAKVSAHIVKKVCDKLNGLFNNERESFSKFWNDIKPFVEYGCMRDRKFYDRCKDLILYQIAGGEPLTLTEYLEKVEEKTGGKKVYYATDPVRQASYITLFSQQEIPVAVLDAIIDSQFISFMENEHNNEVKFVRIDSDIDGVLKQEDKTGESALLKELFGKVAKEGTEIVFEHLKSESTPAMITFSEEERRFEDMMKLYAQRGGGAPMPGSEKLLVNLNCSLVKNLEEMAAKEEKAELCEKLARQIYMLAVLAQRQLGAEETEAFIQDTLALLGGIN